MWRQKGEQIRDSGSARRHPACSRPAGLAAIA